jgi:phosphoribosylanthranilate isomerase
MRVKICGLTREEDAKAAQALGAWALGFIFYPKSKRYIAPETAAKIIEGLDTQAIGVFVNQTDAVTGIARQVGLGGIQLHGDETPDDCRRTKDNFDGLVIKAFRPQTEADIVAIGAYKGVIDYALLDSGTGGQYGGTGHTFDWSLAIKAAASGIPLILAGGLTAENIIEARDKVNPYAADLSSGVESAPGIKDRAKLDTLFGVLGRSST